MMQDNQIIQSTPHGGKRDVTTVQESNSRQTASTVDGMTASGTEDEASTETDYGALPEDEDDLDRDEIFEVLSNERRRLVLHYLKRQSESESVDFATLVDQVAAWENETQVRDLDSSDRKCVYTALRQTHLPKLDDLGVVNYDSQRGGVTLTDKVEDIEVYMEYIPEHDVSWSRLYLLLSSLSGLFVFLVWGGIGPFGGVSGFALATGIILAFGISALYHTYQSRWTTASDAEAIET